MMTVTQRKALAAFGKHQKYEADVKRAYEIIRLRGEFQQLIEELGDELFLIMERLK